MDVFNKSSIIDINESLDLLVRPSSGWIQGGSVVSAKPPFVRELYKGKLVLDADSYSTFKLHNVIAE